MSVLNIRPVESGQSKALIGIAGQSGDGKTYTALQIARGMVSDPSKIGFLDTENKRGSLYAGILDGPFMIGDLYPPFSPARYSLAIKEFQDAGIEVLIIDSVTHEWEMGCEEIAYSPKANGEPRKIADWVTAKREHKKFMNVLLQSDMDIICCIRAREKTDFTNMEKPVSLGIQPVCEKNFMFEMTASIMMFENGTVQKHLKVPSFLKESFGTGKGYLGIDTGKKIRKWLDQGEKEDPEIAKIKSEALMVCEQGTEALNALFKSLSKEYQKNIKIITHFGICKESAIAYDEMNNPADGENAITIDGLKGLFDEVEPYLNDEEKAHCKRIIDEKEVNSYQKLHKFLTDKTK